MPTLEELVDSFHRSWLTAHPFEASYFGISGYDDLVPDQSEAGEDARRSRVAEFAAAVGTIDDGALTMRERTTLSCLLAHCEQELAEIDSRSNEYVVTAMPFKGPAEVLAVAARTVLPDASSAESYLARLRETGRLIDQQTDRLRLGASKGRLPVAPLIEQAIAWAEQVLTPPVPEAVLTPEPPPHWPGANDWRAARDLAGQEVLKPALARWVAQLREVLPEARPAEQAGLAYLPGGDVEYARAIRIHTTLPLTAEELHASGLAEVETLEARATALGQTIGLRDLGEVRSALRASAGAQSPEMAMASAQEAVRRAEARLQEVFTPPLPEPCVVSAMPPVVARSGMAPHYTPARLDGARAGTYWFNTEVPTAGTGWDLEGVAFHEAVPGHHLQFGRLASLDLPDMQRQRHVTVYGEGWGLYAEQLAEEMGLYSSTETLLGAITAALMRAARLVLDTGLHAFGWGRARAVEYFVEHVPMPPEFLAAEVDRYIAWPGQALAYLTGKRQILQLRDEAERRLGRAFSLPAFHSAVLDSGSLPMPALRTKIEDWASRP